MKIGKKSSLTRTRRQGRLRRRWPRQQTPESPHETSLGQPLLIWPEALSLYKSSFFSSFLTFSPFGCATPPLNKSKKKKKISPFLKNKLGTPPSILSRAGLAPVSQSRSFSLIQWKLNLFWTLREEETGFCVLQTTFLKKPKRGDGYLCAGGRGRVFDPDARPSWKEGGGIVCV